jgi:hypothetical protein
MSAPDLPNFAIAKTAPRYSHVGNSGHWTGQVVATNGGSVKGKKNVVGANLRNDLGKCTDKDITARSNGAARYDIAICPKE